MDTTTTAAQYLTFALGDEEFGVGIHQAREIIELDAITSVPNAAPHIRGVINLRGSVVPVVDLAKRLGRGSSTPTRRSCIVLVDVAHGDESVVMGIMVDRVTQVAELADEDIEPVPTIGTGIQADYLKGLGRSGKRFILLLDIDRLL